MGFIDSHELPLELGQEASVGKNVLVCGE